MGTIGQSVSFGIPRFSEMSLSTNAPPRVSVNRTNTANTFFDQDSLSLSLSMRRVFAKTNKLSEDYFSLGSLLGIPNLIAAWGTVISISERDLNET